MKYLEKKNIDNILNLLNDINSKNYKSFFYLKIKYENNIIKKSIVIDIYELTKIGKINFNILCDILKKYSIFNMSKKTFKNLNHIYDLKNERIEISINIENMELENIYFFYYHNNEIWTLLQ